MEEWKTVIINSEVYENYQVSNLGNVKSLHDRYGKERILKFGKNKDNYLHVVLYKDGKRKTCLVHRLVAETFLPKIEGKNHVDHIDGDPSNNVYTNLRWCTPKENSNFELCKKHKSENSAWKGKTGALHNTSKAVLCLENGKIYGSTMEASRELGINNRRISECCNGRRKAAGGYHWRYVD